MKNKENAWKEFIETRKFTTDEKKYINRFKGIFYQGFEAGVDFGYELGKQDRISEAEKTILLYTLWEE